MKLERFTKKYKTTPWRMSLFLGMQISTMRRHCPKGQPIDLFLSIRISEAFGLPLREVRPSLKIPAYGAGSVGIDEIALVAAKEIQGEFPRISKMGVEIEALMMQIRLKERGAWGVK